MSTDDESISVKAPASRDLGAQAMKAEVAASLFGEAATPLRVGPYEIIEILGAGGMGVVYAAWDETLGRRVAIKVLPAELVGDDRERARLVREAQALAKLSHPNVVHVYEVGEHAGGVFVAMELVEGSSLRAWQAQQARSIAEIVEVYTQAGRGLWAAHQAGLVHRDFKPANVLLGKDGRVRVLDFGLAQGPGLAAASTSPTGRRLKSSSVGSVTRTGARAGTPAYMAPEQLAGAGADARADQFSFCVALYEAVVGCRPFEPLALRQAAFGSAPAPAKGGRRLPWSLRRALGRGLAIEPSRRWPDMDALLRAMVARSIWRRRLGTWAGPAALGLGIVVLALVEREGPEECEAPRHGPLVDWDRERQASVHEALLRTGKPYAEDTWRTVERRLGRHASEWSETHLQSCLTGDEDHRARVSDCLARDHVRFSKLVDELESVDPQSVAKVIEGLDTLDDPGLCARPRAVPGSSALPAELVEALEQARARAAMGRYEDADAQLEQLQHDPALVGSPEHAALLGLRGRVLVELERFAQAQGLLAEAAARAGTDELRVQSLLDELDLLLDLERWQSVEDLSVRAEVLIETVNPSPDRVADYLDIQGRLKLEGDPADPDAAVKLHLRALGKRSQPDARATISTRMRLANAYAERGDTDQAARIYEEVLALREREVGPAHPEVAAVLFDLGLLAFDSGDHATARARLERAWSIERAALGPDSMVAARTESKLAETLVQLDQLDQALRHARSAWEVQRSQLPRGHTDREAALRILTTVEDGLGLHRESLIHNRQLIEEFGAEGYPDVLQNIAWLSCQVEQCADAQIALDRARVQIDALLQQRASLDEGTVLQLIVLRLYTDHVEALVRRVEGDADEALKILDGVLTRTRALDVPAEDWVMRQHVDKLLGEATAVVEEIRAQDDHAGR